MKTFCLFGQFVRHCCDEAATTVPYHGRLPAETILRELGRYK
ncbi:MAG: hypothetical protein ACRDDC_06930 [Tannerellaceae bacterium]